MFSFGSARKRDKQASEPIGADAPPAAAPDAKPPHAHQDAAAHDDILDHIVTLIESDLKRVAGKMDAAGGEVRARIGASAAVVDTISRDTQALALTTNDAVERTHMLRSAFDELAKSNEEIERQASLSAGLADNAQSIAAEAADSVDQLSKAIGEIERVVTVISEIAGQTNLLALNATIEAARAGAAGKGFAVVASEVKALSVETRNATGEIAATIERLKATAAINIDAVGRIIKSIDEIKPSFERVKGAVEQQVRTAADMGGSVDETASFAHGVAERARAMTNAASQVATATQDVSVSADAMNATVKDVIQRLGMMLRQMPQWDRRHHDRLPVSLKGEIRAGGKTTAVETIDLSLGGCLLKYEGDQLAIGTRVEMRLERLGTEPGQVVAISPLGTHLKFAEDHTKTPNSVSTVMEELSKLYAHYIERAQRGAAAVEQAMTKAVDDGLLSLDALFDVAYKPIAGSNPQQCGNRALDVLDRILPQVQEPLLASDASMVFCAAVDINGYLPVHNNKYSLPQRPDDPVWNAANSRNRRIFDDRAGLMAARNTRPFLVQVYRRDLGGGQFVMMKEVDAPVFVKGRHWGGFRTSYKL